MEEPKTLREMHEDLLRRLYLKTVTVVEKPKTKHNEAQQLLREAASMFAISLSKMEKD